MNEQAKGHLLRGRISVRSPANGKVLKRIGGARRVVTDRTAAEAAVIYMKGFLKSRYAHVTAGTRRSVELAVKRAAAGLSEAAMGQITSAMIKNYMNSNGKSSETELRYAQKFWDFCRAQGIYQEENPITAYLQASAGKS